MQRATCKACSIKIDKDTIRIGTSVPGPGDYDLTSWRHLACQKKKPPALDELRGMAALKPADMDTVKAWFAGDMTPVLADKRKSDEATATAASAPSTPKKSKTTATSSANTPTTAKAASSSLPPNLADETAQRDAAAAIFGRMTIPDLKACTRIARDPKCPALSSSVG